jgi:hypothetical protein
MGGNVSEWVFSEADGIQLRGIGFKELNPPIWFWGMATTVQHGGRGMSLNTGLRVVRDKG